MKTTRVKAASEGASRGLVVKSVDAPKRTGRSESGAPRKGSQRWKASWFVKPWPVMRRRGSGLDPTGRRALVARKLGTATGRQRFGRITGIEGRQIPGAIGGRLAEAGRSRMKRDGSSGKANGFRLEA